MGMQNSRKALESLWRELVDFGHEPARIYLGLWSGPRVHEVQFLAFDSIVETLPLYIPSASEFDELRQFAAELSAEERDSELPRSSSRQSSGVRRPSSDN
jgi:hypothetical protein